MAHHYLPIDYRRGWMVRRRPCVSVDCATIRRERSRPDHLFIADLRLIHDDRGTSDVFAPHENILAHGQNGARHRPVHVAHIGDVDDGHVVDAVHVDRADAISRYEDFTRPQWEPRHAGADSN